MILTEKQIKTLAAFKGKMEYVEVEVIGLGGVKKTELKLVKVVEKKETKKSAYFDKTLGLVGNDGIRSFVKSEKEIADQAKANAASLPSSMRK